MRGRLAVGGLLLAVVAVSAPATAHAVGVGARAPDVGLPDMDGRRVRIPGYRGKVVIVDFWASWCEPCRDEMPALQRLYARYFRQGLRVVGVSVDRDRSDAERFIGRTRVRFRNVHDPQRNVARRYGLGTMPSSYIIDHRGIVRHVNDGFRSGDARRMERVVQQLLEAVQESGASSGDDPESDPDPEGDPEGDPVEDDPDPNEGSGPAEQPPEVEPSEAGRSGGLCGVWGRGAGVPWGLVGLALLALWTRRRRR